MKCWGEGLLCCVMRCSLNPRPVSPMYTLSHAPHGILYTWLSGLGCAGLITFTRSPIFLPDDVVIFIARPTKASRWSVMSECGMTRRCGLSS